MGLPVGVTVLLIFILLFIIIILICWFWCQSGKTENSNASVISMPSTVSLPPSHARNSNRSNSLPSFISPYPPKPPALGFGDHDVNEIDPDRIGLHPSRRVAPYPPQNDIDHDFVGVYSPTSAPYPSQRSSTAPYPLQRDDLHSPSRRVAPYPPQNEGLSSLRKIAPYPTDDNNRAPYPTSTSYYPPRHTAPYPRSSTMPQPDISRSPYRIERLSDERMAPYPPARAAPYPPSHESEMSQPFLSRMPQPASSRISYPPESYTGGRLDAPTAPYPPARMRNTNTDDAGSRVTTAVPSAVRRRKEFAGEAPPPSYDEAMEDT